MSAPTITIDSQEWSRGIDEDYRGGGEVINCDINSVSGVLRSARKFLPDATLTTSDPITGAVMDTINLKFFVGTRSGSPVWHETDVPVTPASTWTATADLNTSAPSAGTLVSWNDWLINIRKTSATSPQFALDAFGPLSNAPGTRSWVNNFQTGLSAEGLSPIYDFVAHVSSDGVIYWTAGECLMSLSENAGSTFSPSVSSTYTVNQCALDLPEGYNAWTLADYGGKLLIGTMSGYSDAVSQVSVDHIFPWDRVSSSFDAPSELAVAGVNQMVVRNNLVYIISGRTLDITATNLSYAERLITPTKRLMSNTFLTSPAGAITNTEGFYFSSGVESVSSGYFGIPETLFSDVDTVALWEYRKGALSVHRFSASTGKNFITKIKPCGADNFLFVTNNEGGNLNYVYIQSNSYHSNYPDGVNTDDKERSMYITRLYDVGTVDEPATFQEIEFVLNKKLSTDEGIAIEYRQNIEDPWTTIKVWKFADVGAITRYRDKALIRSVAVVQLRITLFNETGITSPELVSVTLRG